MSGSSVGDSKQSVGSAGFVSGSPSFKRQHMTLNDDDDDDEFPDTIEGFGYKFNEFGQLRHIQTGARFEFQVKQDDHDYNQRRYEALGEVITDYVYDLVIREGKLQKATIPIDAADGEPTTFILHSKNAFTTTDRLVILIHGSGVVRAGQWARRLIVNDSLNSGTQLPFVKRAEGLGYEVIVLNTNDNSREGKGPVRGSESPESHTTYVWENLVVKSPAKYVAIIAHSYGGIVTIHLANSYPHSFQERIFAIAFTDSPHSLSAQGTSTSMIQWLKKVARNWVSSSQPLDTPLHQSDDLKIPCVSAGNERHDMTSWSSFASIFEFLDQKYRRAISPAYRATLGRKDDL